jgi:hypothetical protein
MNCIVSCNHVYASGQNILLFIKVNFACYLVSIYIRVRMDFFRIFLSDEWFRPPFGKTASAFKIFCVVRVEIDVDSPILFDIIVHKSIKYYICEKRRCN